MLERSDWLISISVISSHYMETEIASVVLFLEDLRQQ